MQATLLLELNVLGAGSQDMDAPKSDIKPHPLGHKYISPFKNIINVF